MFVGQRRDVALDQDLGLAIRGHRIESGSFIVESIPGRAVGAARRREDKALHAGCLGQFGQPDRSLMVDVVGEARIEVAQRII